jgi:hypothetical protein
MMDFPNLTEASNFYAAYMFIILAIVLLVIGFHFKVTWVFYISTASWGLAGLYFVLNSGANTYVQYLGLFLIVAGLGTAFSPMIVNKREIEELEAPKTYKQRLELNISEYRKLRAPRQLARPKQWYQEAEGEND